MWAARTSNAAPRGEEGVGADVKQAISGEARPGLGLEGGLLAK